MPVFGNPVGREGRFVANSPAQNRLGALNNQAMQNWKQIAGPSQSPWPERFPLRRSLTEFFNAT